MHIPVRRQRSHGGRGFFSCLPLSLSLQRSNKLFREMMVPYIPRKNRKNQLNSTRDLTIQARGFQIQGQMQIQVERTTSRVARWDREEREQQTLERLEIAGLHVGPFIWPNWGTAFPPTTTPPLKPTGHYSRSSPPFRSAHHHGDHRFRFQRA